MNNIVLFDLIKEVSTKDKTGQSIKVKTYQCALGKQKSVYQNEFYQAEQAGLRPQGVIVMNRFDYSNEKMLKIGNDEFVIYRTFEVGTDKIELYYGERVGTRNGSGDS